jgi:hypothetical protein
MGRIINTESTGKHRNQMRRTIAELLRRLSTKQSVDQDVKDMLAMIVYCLREIEDGIDASVIAWEKRGYWIKAEGFRREWSWVSKQAGEIAELIYDESWDNLPQTLVGLFPKFADINVAKYTREPELWQGAHQRLIAERND